MNRTRLAAVAVFGLVFAAACTAKQNNGEECLKNFDCESDRCVQYVCVDPAGQRAAPSDTGVAETAADGGQDTTPPPVDSGTDTGSPADTTPETPADASSD